MAGLSIGFALVGALLQAPTTPPVVDSGARSHDPAFDSAAVIAWRQFERLWVPATGLAKATFDYDKLTTWDVGSVMAALYSAEVLGLLEPGEYFQRMTLTLGTLAKMPLFADSVFHKLYDANTARMVNREG